MVRRLLHAQCRQWADAPLTYLDTSGTDNAMWRVNLEGETDVIVRLPRRPGAAAGVGHELAALQNIAANTLGSLVQTPTVRHVGHPHDAFAHRWSVLSWIDGTDAWTARHALVDPATETRLATDLALVVAAIGQVGGDGMRFRKPGDRGGPLAPVIERLAGWLKDPVWQADRLIDVAAVERLMAAGREVVDDPVTHRFVHGDLIPGNLLVEHGRLNAVIDWGGAGVGDPAQDLAPAWAVLSAPGRAVFRQAVGADDAVWIRARTFELEHAVGGVLYYRPRNHLLGDVMTRTLQHILDEADGSGR